MVDNNLLQIGKLKLSSRLILGTTDIISNRYLIETLKESETSLITVSIKNAVQKSENTFLKTIKKLDGVTIIPNTAGAYTAEDAISLAKAGCEILSTDIVKLEVIGDRDTLLPNTLETIKAAQTLIKDGINVMAYTNDDPIAARKLCEIGCSAIMPLGSPIGSGLGILNPHNIKIIRKIIGDTKTPIIIDAGIGSPYDVIAAMELGCDGVLISSAIHKAQKPILMAKAMKLAVEAGRLSLLAGRISKTSLSAIQSSNVVY